MIECKPRPSRVTTLREQAAIKAGQLVLAPALDRAGLEVEIGKPEVSVFDLALMREDRGGA